MIAGAYTERMTRAQAGQLVDHLQAAVRSGLTLLTWNGLGFDFDILAEESGRLADCAALAMAHVDMMFNLFCLRGHGLALDKAAQGMGLPGKLPGMSGELAPLYWKDGKQGIVLDYVAQDVRTTLDVADAVEARRALRWISMTGNEQFLRMPEGWLTVERALKLPLPITTRMRNPWTRAKFTGWLEKVTERIPPDQAPSIARNGGFMNLIDHHPDRTFPRREYRILPLLTTIPEGSRASMVSTASSAGS